MRATVLTRGRRINEVSDILLEFTLEMWIWQTPHPTDVQAMSELAHAGGIFVHPRNPRRVVPCASACEAMDKSRTGRRVRGETK